MGLKSKTSLGGALPLTLDKPLKRPTALNLGSRNLSISPDTIQPTHTTDSKN